MNNNNFKKQKNLLREFILKGSSKEYSKQTIIGLFRSMVETILEAQSQEALILYKLNNTDGLSSVLKRLEFSAASVYSYSNNTEITSIENIEKDDIWEDVEFLLVLAPRYTAVLIWDYSLSMADEMSEICLIYNSRSVGEAARVIFDNSKIDLDKYLTDYAPDRRENELLNIAINKLVSSFNSVNEEIVFNEAEKENLAKTQELLQEYEYTSDRAKFIAHEIKNHLSVIDLYTKIADKRFSKTNIDAQTKESVENAFKCIKNSVYSITQYIEGLKTFAKPILTEKKLSSLVHDVVTLSMPKAKEHNVKIETVIQNDFRVHVDEVKIQSVLLNLVYNAIEAIDNNGKVIINCSSKKDNFAQVVICDNGCGIPEEQKDKIFEQGYTTKITGNGLGLNICQSLMKEQYGSINLLKSDDNGTQMEVLIPII